MPEEDMLKSELGNQILELKEKLAREEGRREGSNRILTMFGVLVSAGLIILVGAAITSLNRFQMTAQENIKVTLEHSAAELGSTLESNIFNREATLESNTSTREAGAATHEAKVVEDFTTMVAGDFLIIQTRAIEQESTRSAQLESRAETRIADIANNVATRDADLAATSEAVSLQISTHVFEAISQTIDSEALQLVATNLILTRATELEQSFEERVESDVMATSEAIMTVTAAAPTATSTPEATSTP